MPLSMHVAMDLELLCMCVLMVCDGNRQEEPGWHWKRAESFPNSHGFESCMQLMLYFVECLP